MCTKASWVGVLLAVPVLGMKGTVLGTTNTQAVIAYVAPSTAPCTVEVSEQPSLTPVVPDVDATLFSGANLDSRTGSVVRGRERVVVIGKRTIERATAGTAHSRALQAATLHYYRITCGGDVTTGTFQTKTIPLGNTHADEVIIDPETPTNALLPSPVYTRNATWVDPHTGALIRRVSQPGDNNNGISTAAVAFGSVLSDTNWTNSANSQAQDGSSATYNGASCGATCDWLMVSRDVAGQPYAERTDTITITVRGSGSAAASADRTIEVCPVGFGTTEIDPDGKCQELALPQSTLGNVSSTHGLVDTWRKPGKPEWTTAQIYTSGHLRFALRKKTATGSVSIDALSYAWRRSQQVDVGTGGNFERCSTLTRTDDDGPRYLCTAFTGGAMTSLYSIHAENGTARYLGVLIRTTGKPIVQDHMLWDATNPNRFYATPVTDSNPWIFDYAGTGADRAGGWVAELNSTEITGLTSSVSAFVSANSAQYPISFNSAAFPSFFPADVQGDYLILRARRGNQDTYAWMAVYRLSTQSIVAATPQFASPASRWCTHHAQDIVWDQGVAAVSTQVGLNDRVGSGLYRNQLVSGIDASATTIQVTSTCSGDTCTGHITGEPVSATHADNYLMPAEVGDVFTISGNEYIRITQKNSPTEWVIQRNLLGGARPHAAGANVTATCANKPGTGPNNYVNSTPIWIWDYLRDPYGMSMDHTWANLYAGHATARGNTLVAIRAVAKSAPGTKVMAAVKDPTFSMSVPESPHFAGFYPPAEGNTWQQHPNNNHVNTTGVEREMFWDIRPFVGSNAILPDTVSCNPDAAIFPASGGCAAARVSGLTNVYRLAIGPGGANTDGLNVKQLANYGVSGTTMLRNVSGPGSVLDDSAGKNYTYCHAVLANECVSGSLAGYVYAQIPGLTSYRCTTSASAADVCVSDMPMMGEALGQHGYLPNKDGVARGSGAGAYGAGWMREIARLGLSMTYRRVSQFATGKPLANGRWVLAADWVQGGSLMAIVKVPPLVKDTVNRSTFVPVPVRIGSVPRGADNVVVEFGYAERGAPDAYRCTSRAEACVATSATINEANPFFFASESYSGLSCAGGCTVTIPAYPSRVVHYRVRYRNAANQVLLDGPLEIAVAP